MQTENPDNVKINSPGIPLQPEIIITAYFFNFGENFSLNQTFTANKIIY